MTVPEPDYLLAMKILALRAQIEDENDALFLIKQLGLETKGDVLKIVADYYPRKEITPRTLVWLDEHFSR